jgi:hypothetical protein
MLFHSIFRLVIASLKFVYSYTGIDYVLQFKLVVC